MKPTEQTKLLVGRERMKIIDKLNEQFGIKDIKGNLLKKEKGKIFLFEGNFGKKEIDKLEKATFIESIGIYFAKEEEQGITLSLEGSQILKNQITKNTIEFTKEEAENWMNGYEVIRKNNFTGFVIIKYKDDMLGTGKSSEEKITKLHSKI